MRRLKALAGGPLTLTETGRVGRYGLYLLRLAKRAGRRREVFLSAGIHGDEPAGVEAVLRFLEQQHEHGLFLNQFSFLIFPCLNPSGYEHDTRVNTDGLDLNRQYDRPEPPVEVRVVQQAIRRRPPDFFVDLHEDVDAQGFYLYELVRARQPAVGEQVIAAVGRAWPVDRRLEIEGLPSREGVIRPSRILHRVRRLSGWPQAIYLFLRGARHCLTCETPTSLPFETRVAMHLTALRVVLSHWQRAGPTARARRGL